MKDAKSFFSGSKTYKSKCEIRHYIIEANNCESISQNFISHSYNASTGVVTVSTNTSYMPTGIDVNTIVYKPFINGVKAQESDYSVTGGSLTLVINDADSVYGMGTTIYGDSPYIVKIVATIPSKETGCVFEYIVPAISNDRFGLISNADVYSIVYTPLGVETFDIDNGSYIWRVNGRVVQSGGTSIDLSNKKLINYTEKQKAVCTVELVGANVLLKTESINILRNNYLIQTVYQEVINGNDFYLNFSTTHNAVNNKVRYYIDNILLSETHMLWNDAKGKMLTTVIFPNLATVPNVFTKDNTDEYTAYFSQEIENEVNFEFSYKKMLNIVTNGIISNSFYPQRKITIDKRINGNFLMFENVITDKYSNTDENPTIMEYTSNESQSLARTGLVFNKIKSSGEKERFVMTEELTEKAITHNSIVRKEDIYVNDEPTTFYSSLADLAIDFTGQFNLLDDTLIGITTKDNGTDTTITFEASAGEEIIVVDFETGFVRASAPNGSGLFVSLHDENNIKMSEFGLFKINQNEYAIMNDDNSISHKFQMSYNKGFHIRTSSSNVARRMKIRFNNCIEDNIGIKNIVITTRRI